MAGPETLDWQQLLRDKGYRLTPQRELVLSAVDRLGHATPDEILAAVREQSSAVNVSTVYRTLELLEELADEFDGWQALLRERHGFEAALGPLTVFGRCQECRDD